MTVPAISTDAFAFDIYRRGLSWHAWIAQDGTKIVHTKALTFRGVERKIRLAADMLIFGDTLLNSKHQASALS